MIVRHVEASKPTHFHLTNGVLTTPQGTTASSCVCHHAETILSVCAETCLHVSNDIDPVGLMSPVDVATPSIVLDGV